MFTALLPTCRRRDSLLRCADSQHSEHPHISHLKIATRLGAAVGILLILLGSSGKRPRMDNPTADKRRLTQIKTGQPWSVPRLRARCEQPDVVRPVHGYLRSVLRPAP